MKIFLDTANIAVIKKWTFFIDGVTTNPSHLAAAGNPIATIKSICSLLPNKKVSVQVTEQEPAKIYQQARTIAKLADNVVVKIPCYEPYYPIIEQLVKEGIALNITLVFSLVQSLYMCKLGVAYISPFIGRWDDIDADGTQVLYDIKQMIEQYNYQTQLLAASIRSVRHVHDAILAGADIITIPIEVLETSTKHVLTDQGMKKFNDDWQKLGIQQFP